jgi:hypothetical protein
VELELLQLRLRANEMLWHCGSDFRLLERVIFHTLQHAKACLGAEKIMKRWLVLFMLDSVPFPPRPLFLPQPPFVSHGLEYLFDFFLFLLVTFSGNFNSIMAMGILWVSQVG